MPEGYFQLIFPKSMRYKIEDVVAKLKKISPTLVEKIQDVRSVTVVSFDTNLDPIFFNEKELEGMVGSIEEKSKWVKAIGWDEYGKRTLLGCDSESAYSFTYDEDSYLSFNSTAQKWNKGISYLELVDKTLVRQKKTRLKLLDPYLSKIEEYAFNASNLLGVAANRSSLEIISDHENGETIGKIIKWQNHGIEYFLLMQWTANDCVSFEAYKNPDSLDQHIIVAWINEKLDYAQFIENNPSLTDPCDWRIDTNALQPFPCLMMIDEDNWWPPSLD